jgi:secondary thiamine-phosphate synthase enzyme
VLRDLARWMERLAPESSTYEHDDEGPDDMPSHLRSAITRTGEVLPVAEGKLLLGIWQGIYVWEHRAAPHRRRVVVTVTGA